MLNFEHFGLSEIAVYTWTVSSSTKRAVWLWGMNTEEIERVLRRVVRTSMAYSAPTHYPKNHTYL